VGVHGGETKAKLNAYEFGGIDTVLDVGGGNSSLLVTTLGRYPSLRGVVIRTLVGRSLKSLMRIHNAAGAVDEWKPSNLPLAAQRRRWLSWRSMQNRCQA
jgi:hypothetical protein